MTRPAAGQPAAPSDGARPHVVIVDDSETFLALERAALEDRYAITTASDGAEGLARIRQLRPDVALIDLAMPAMNGDDVLRAMKADPELASIPVVIVSSQVHRGPEVRALGAEFLPKPVDPEELVATVARVLSLASGDDPGPDSVLVIESGGASVAIAVRDIASVLDELATRPLVSGPSYLREMFVLHGEPIVVLDLARRLRRPPRSERLARKLVVLGGAEGVRLALRVDRVHDPEDVPPGAWRPASRVAGLGHSDLRDLCRGVVVSARGPMVVLRSGSLVRAGVLRRLRGLLERSFEAAAET
ncbi:MAG: response regulator [Deltaproteobacteria bacterium]|nr:response regulator [Deltaproteobacteria bacterium]